MDEYKNDNLPSDSEIYNQVILEEKNIDDFLDNVKFLEENEKVLDAEPIENKEEKKKELESCELKTLELEGNLVKLSDNIDELLQTYNETVDIINKKFSLYNQILDSKK